METKAVQTQSSDVWQFRNSVWKLYVQREYLKPNCTIIIIIIIITIIMLLPNSTFIAV